MDAAGAVVQKLDYLPLGSERVNIKSGAFDTHFTYTDQEKDAESGLLYYGARYYHPTLGRFTQVDPVFGDIADPQSLNKYAYVRNNPLRYIDPTGAVKVETDKSGKTTMTIEKGDTLSRISPMFNMNPQQMASALSIQDPNKIQAGARYDVTKLLVGGTIVIHLKNGYTVRIDPGRYDPKAPYDVHVFNQKGEQVASENMDGTKHDKGPLMPDKIRKELEQNKRYQDAKERSERKVRDNSTDKNNNAGSGAQDNRGSVNSEGSLVPESSNPSLFFMPLPIPFPTVPVPIMPPIFTPQMLPIPI